MALALASRRSTIAAVTSALLAMTLAAAVVGRSCRMSAPGPEDAVRDLIRAAEAGDVGAVLELLSPQTRARLERAATQATHHAAAGPTRRFEPKDMINLATPGVGISAVGLPSDITVLTEHGDHAVVLVASRSGRGQLELVRVDGKWLIDVPGYAVGMPAP